MSNTSPSSETFLRALKRQATVQSHLQKNPLIPTQAAPIASIIGLHPWQTLLVSSFVGSTVVFLIWFEFFFRFVQNIAN